jgi:putative copper export protein
VWAARAHVALAALAMIGLAATGHAAVVSGPYYSSLAAAWAHYLAAAVWVGGILYFAVVLLPATSKLEVSERARARVALLGGFTPYALLAGATLANTGLLRAEVHLPSLSVTVLRQLVRTAYGQALLAKLSLVALMAGVGALHSFWYRRKVWQLLAGGAEKEEVGKPRRRWQRLVQWEAVLAILVMASVAVLITRPALRYGFGNLASPSLGEAGRG